ncbi:oxidoreductase [Tannerella sp. oral taxon BU063 isolate Cell 2]|uniref:Oxidoreductase n=1 Tax=Tannerella sp. oral taxon BU063 isolate Cell 2 TaxID=1411148 RepID=W2C2Z1_9BACT|nr:oxidoreductase [Tannerella sp. oral taxon BU063 isolate Cell 2]
MKRAVIVGATSGLGLEVARLLLERGWSIGVAGRRVEALEQLRTVAPDRVRVHAIDVTQSDAPDRLHALIDDLGGMDLYFHSSGIGRQNPDLDPSIELSTVRTNGEGFVRMVTAAYRYFRTQGHGHIAAITSVAGTRGMGAAAAYSATKRFQRTYLDALAQLAHREGLRLHITDIRPGFVRTALLNPEVRYPMLMEPAPVARRIVDAVERRRRVATIDRRYRALVLLWRLLPQCVWERMKI